MITYFPRNFKMQDYVDITLKSTRYFNQTASVTLTLIKRLHVIWEVVDQFPVIGNVICACEFDHLPIHGDVYGHRSGNK